MALVWYQNEINEEIALQNKLKDYHGSRESPLVQKLKDSKLPCSALMLDDALLLRIFIKVSQEDLLALSHVCLRFFRVSRTIMKLCIQHQTYRLDLEQLLHSGARIPHADADRADDDNDDDEDDEEEDEEEEDEDSVAVLFRQISTHDEAPAQPSLPLVVRYMQLRKTAERASEPVFRRLTSPAAFVHIQNVFTVTGLLQTFDRYVVTRTDGGRLMTLPFASHEQYQQWEPSLSRRIEEWQTAYPKVGRGVQSELSVRFYSKQLLVVGLSWLCHQGLLFLEQLYPNLRFGTATAAVVQSLPELLARIALYPLELATDRLWSMLCFSSTAECGDLMLTCSSNRSSSLSLITKFFDNHAETAEIRYQRRWWIAIVAQVLRESPVSPWTGLGLALLETFGIEAGSFFLASRANGIRSFKPADIFCYQPSHNFYRHCLQPLRCILTPLRLRSATEGVPGRPDQPQRPSSENFLINPVSLTSYFFESLDPMMHLKIVITTMFDPATILFAFSDTLFKTASGAFRRHNV